MVDLFASRRSKEFVWLAVLIAVAGGCATASQSPRPTEGSAPTPSAAASPAATPSPVATPSPAPSPSSAPTAGPSPLALCAKGQTPCPVPAGTYSTAPFEHPFLVTIPSGWTNDRAGPHGGQLADASARGYLEWGSDFIGGVGPSGKETKVGTTGDELLAYIRSFKDFEISPAVPVTIGGLTGKSVDISTKDTLARAFLGIPEDSYNLGPGEKARFMVFTVGGSAVLIMVEVPEEKNFEAEIAAMQPVLDSIVWQ
jgi:hypothetical protein